MGVESDQLVFDYLSRVGDLAQTALPAAQRMRLVAQLRNDIDRERRGSDNTAAVRRILGRIGTPDEVVEAAAGSAGSAAGSAGRTGAPTAPEQPAADPPPGTYGPYAKREPRTPGPHDRETDWWRSSPAAGGGRMRAGDELAGLTGMTGSVFFPIDDEELAEKDPPPRRTARPQEDADEEAAEEEAGEEAPPSPRKARRLLPRIRRGRGGEGGGGGGGGGAAKRWGSPVLLLAAALLIAGAAIGSWIPLGLGWLTGYLSRRLTRTQAKFAVLGIPGAAAVGLAVWLWGRDAGRWSTPIAHGQTGQAIQDALPATVRLAAIGTALYLLWRARRSA